MRLLIFKCILILVFSTCFYLSNAQTIGSFGNVKANVGVGTMGNAQASISIYTPPGRMGMIPNIAVIVSNAQIYGPAGKGSSITGLSSICRSGRNYHIHGNQEGVKFNSEDIFVLDGNQLVLISGVYGQPGSVYRTEEDVFDKVVFNGNTFTVYHKHGEMSFYGGANNSSYSPSGSPLPYSYHLYRRYDKQGNYIEYSYQSSTTGINIASIAYSGFDDSFNGTKAQVNPKESPFNRIDFTYELTEYSYSKFVSGYLLKNAYRLNKIEVYCTSLSAVSKKVRTYEFAYAVNNFVNLLSEVIEKNEISEELAPVYINWSQPENAMKYSGQLNSIAAPVFNPNGNSIEYRFGNFSGKGKRELLRSTRGINKLEARGED